jgi:Glycosyltransferase family 87
VTTTAPLAVSRVLVRSRVLFALCGLAAMAGLVVWWVQRAYNEAALADVGLAYEGGAVAWATGHPEHLATWISTPFLGAVMAVVTRLMSGPTAANLLISLNLCLVVGTAGAVLYHLRTTLQRRFWWLLAFGMISFGPMLSTVWWKQFNLIALAGSLAGFYLIRKGQESGGAALIGVSIAVKPLAILLPFVLAARRETRRAGILALGWVVALNVFAQAFMAERAGNLATMNVLPLLKDFADKAKPENIWACHTENFAPGSLLCRLAGGQNWDIQHAIVWTGVALLGAWIVDALRGRKMTSWEVFAFTCAVSTMVSPIAWSHYQIMLAPLFVLLFVKFAREGASIGTWAGLLLAFGLASLMWQPFGTSIGAVRHVIDGAAQTQRALFAIASVAQFAQYVLILTGIMWYLQRRGRPPGVAADLQDATP